MRQAVHNVSYLAVNSIDFSSSQGKTSFEAIALPLGAEVISVNLNVDEASDVGITCDVGLNENKEVFLNDIPLDRKAPHTSAQNLRVASRGSMNLNLSGATTKGKVTLRVLYFLPSTIVAEY